MKTISLKKFRKSRERMTKVQYEHRSGNEVDAPEVYSYVNFFYIEIHKNKEDRNEEFYFVVGNRVLETHVLEAAEEFLYENMKSELPTEDKKEKKKEKIDKKKFPLGLESWLDTHYQIVEYMGYNQSRYEKGVCIHKGSEVIEELDGQAGKQEFAEYLTTEFESRIKSKKIVFADNDVTYYDELDKFLKDAFYPKKKYVAIARVTTECYLEIEANSEEEAQEIADYTDGGDFITDEKSGGDFRVISVRKVKM